MKKLKLLLLIAGTLSICHLKAQTGTSCSNAYAIPSILSKSEAGNIIPTWYSFLADSNIINIEAESFSINKARIITLYSGSCSSLTMLAQDSATSSSDLEVELNYSSLTLGNQYFVKVEYDLTNISTIPYLLSISKLLGLDYILTVTDLTTGVVSTCDDDDPAAPDLCPPLNICLGDVLSIEHTLNSNITSLPYYYNIVNVSLGGSVLASSTIYTGSTFFFTPLISGTYFIKSSLETHGIYVNVSDGSAIPLFSVNPANPVCASECITLTALNNPIIDLNVLSVGFNYANFTPGPTGPICLNFPLAGTYPIIYTLNAGLTCSTTATYSLVVVDPIVHLVGSKDKCNLMQDFTASLNCNPTLGIPVSYEWNIYSGTSSGSIPFYNSISSINTLNYTFPTTGTYYVEIKITINGHTYTTGQVVTIGAITSLPSFVQGDGSCLNLCFNNTSNCIFKNVTQWLWTATGPGGFSQTETSTDGCFTFPTAGIYTICLQQNNNPLGGTDPALIGVSCQTVSVFAPTPIVITNTLLSLCNLPAGGLLTLNPNIILGATGYANWNAYNQTTGAALVLPYTTGINGIITYNLTGFSTYTAPIVFCVNASINGCDANQCITIYPCCPTTSGTVNYNNTTFTSNTTLSGPTNYHFSGVITVNSGVNLIVDIADLTLDPNTKIIVKGSLRIKASYLHACSAMWDGIYLQNAANCQLIQNTIEDAKRAVVDTLGAASITIDNNWFNKNYESIILKATNTTQKLTVVKNVFSSNIIPLAAKTVPVQDWTFTETETSIGALAPTFMLPPYSSQKSYSGITLYQTKTPSNPSQFVQIDKYNLFDKLKFGIVATRSKFVVQKNAFQNITAGKGLFAAIYIYGRTGFLPYLPEAKIGGTPSQGNTFKNCTYGIYSQYGSILSILNNTLTTISRDGILITKNRYDVVIDKNKLFQCLRGINLFDNLYIKADVTNNRITNATTVGLYNTNFGIIVGEVVPTTSTISGRCHNIYNNYIEGHYNGMYISNTFSTQIVDNEAHIRADNTPGNFQMGIRVEGTNKINIKNNSVDKPTADNSAWWQYGIFLDGNIIPAIKCNSINNFYASVKFQMLNYVAPGNGLTFNVFNNFYHGVWLDQNAEIGDQYFSFLIGSNKASMNQWQGTGFYSKTFVDNNSNQNSSPGSGVGSKIYTAGGGFYTLNNTEALLGLVGLNINLFNGTGTSPLFIPCPPSIPTPLMFKSANIAVNNLTYGINTSNLLHVGNRMLVKNIKAEGINLSLPTNAMYKNFVNATYTTSVGQFYRVDSLLNLGISTGSVSTISQAKLLNTSISTPNLLEQNQKWLNTIYIDMQTAEPDSTILLMLEQLAIKCPQYDGEAVYQARSLLMYYFGKSYNSICDAQNIQPIGSRLSNITDSSPLGGVIGASVYPNPTNKDITVTYTKGDDAEAAVFEVYNMVGELILTQTLNENKTTLSLSDLSSGIYIYFIKQEGITLQTNKLVLTK